MELYQRQIIGKLLEILLIVTTQELLIYLFHNIILKR